MNDEKSNTDKAPSVINQAQKIFDQTFLPAAENKLDQESQDTLAKELEEKETKIKNTQLQKVVGDAKAIWARKGELSRTDLLILVAGILYLISPLDAVPDFIPLAGYLDDLAVLTGIVTVLKKTLTFAIDETKKEAEVFREESIAQARQEADDYREETIAKVDEMIDRSFNRTLSGVVLGLWGITTAVALTLLITSLTGRIAYELYFYTFAAGALVLMLNTFSLIDSISFYKSLDEEWQTRFVKSVIGRFNVKRTIILISPLFVFAGLSVLTFMINFAKM